MVSKQFHLQPMGHESIPHPCCRIHPQMWRWQLDTGMHNVVGTVWGTGHIGKSVRVAVELSGTIHIEPRHEAGVHGMVKVIGEPGYISITVESSGTTHIEPRLDTCAHDTVVMVELSGTTHIEHGIDTGAHDTVITVELGGQQHGR